VSESDYWESLRFRINCLPTNHLAGGLLPGWCDWIEPKRYVLAGPSPRISGRVGFVSGRDAWQRRFILLVGHTVGQSSEIEWAMLLPPEDSDAWLWSDQGGQVIMLDPRGRLREIAEPGVPQDFGGE
jgi:hypothetical protein